MNRDILSCSNVTDRDVVFPRCSVLQKFYTELGQPPKSQARPRDTDYLQPSNLAARTLRSVEHAPSKFGHDLCPVKLGLVAAVKCFVRKARFFRRCGTEREKPEPCAGVFQVH